jgi:SAM-dependent methyltransferase
VHEKRFEGDILRLRVPERVERLEVERIVGLCLDDSQVETVLDIGTGTGLFAEAFAGRGLKVSGVDVNPEMLIAARRFVPNGDFREGTVEALPYPDESDATLKTLNEASRVAYKHVGIQEWPYRVQSFGPPLTDRLNPEFLASLFNKAGFRKWNMTNLSNTVFYYLDV